MEVCFNTKGVGLMKITSVTSTEKTMLQKKKRPFYIEMAKQWDLQLLVIPPVLYVILFFYGPMYGIITAFQEFKLGDKFGFSEWVGLRHFKTLFEDPNFVRLMRNNVVMGLLRIIIGFPIPSIFALLLNELRTVWFKKTVQTISYLPYFVSWTVIAALMFDFFSLENGAVNELLVALKILDAPRNWFGNSEFFWGLFTVTHVWQSMGFSAIIFIAGISSIDTELYEAAAIDGAGRFRQMWSITLAGIKPTIIILFILTVGSLMATSFDQVMMLTRMMQNSFLRETADILQSYSFRVGIGQRRFSFGSAVGFYTTMINFVLLVIANWISRRFSETSLF
jgi:putative aldouronate transport system permease protein